MNFRLATIAACLLSPTVLSSAAAQLPPPAPPSLDLDPQLLRSSPVLQRWRDRIPNVQEEIQRDPSFRPRVRVGYSHGSRGKSDGWSVGVEEVLLNRSGFSLSADYRAEFNSKQKSWGTDLRYYVGPLGSSVNFAPVVGYRHLETDRYAARGLNLGARLLLVPSRTGAAELSLTQTWVSPGSAEEVSLTGLAFGYAVTHKLRLSTEIQRQRSRDRRDDRFGIGLEWML